MARVVEINRIEELDEYRLAWGGLLAGTPGASFFQSLDWLEIYWRHFGQRQRLRTLVVIEGDQPIGILPLTVRRDCTRVGRLRLLGFPLDDWWSFYGPIGADIGATLSAGLEHIRNTSRDWDFLEFRWLGAPCTDPMLVQSAMLDAGFQAYPTVTDYAAVVDMSETWDSYWGSRKGSWLRRFRHAERELEKRGEISHVRFRPRGTAHGDGDPRWDLYDACEEIARRSWQANSADGTTLSHESVRGFLREVHESAAAAGAVDLNLLLIGGNPAAFIYGYHAAGAACGLRRGFDAERCASGSGNVLLAYALRDGFSRGDRLYDMGPGALETKRYFQTRLLPIVRFSHFASRPWRAQLLRFARWRQSQKSPASIAVGRGQTSTADPR